jgi:hypothetical protein
MRRPTAVVARCLMDAGVGSTRPDPSPAKPTARGRTDRHSSARARCRHRRTRTSGRRTLRRQQWAPARGVAESRRKPHHSCPRIWCHPRCGTSYSRCASPALTPSRRRNSRDCSARVARSAINGSAGLCAIALVNNPSAAGLAIKANTEVAPADSPNTVARSKPSPRSPSSKPPNTRPGR